jgi:tetraacyldisaccharide-1-P 4'-kinase
MTEKDAIKCQHLPLTNAWVLPLQAVLSPVQQQQLQDTGLLHCVRNDQGVPYK